MKQLFQKLKIQKILYRIKTKYIFILLVSFMYSGVIFLSLHCDNIEIPNINLSERPDVNGVTLSFTDTNPDTGIISGDLMVTRATQEDNLEISSYNLYCGSSETEKNSEISQIEEVLVSSLTSEENITITITDMDITACPYLLIYTENDNGESLQPASSMVTDMQTDMLPLPNVNGITLSFEDMNLNTGVISGDLMVSRATQEVNFKITSYNLYCSSSATNKESGTSPLIQLPVSNLTLGEDIAITIPYRRATDCPYLLVYTENDTGESMQPASIMVIDMPTNIPNPPLPKPTTTGITQNFEDTNLNTGIIAGDLIIASRAAEEVTLEITSYNLYCGSSATTKTSAIEEVLVSTLTPGEVITIPIPNMNITDCPYLLIHTENDTGESTIPAFIMVTDMETPLALPTTTGITQNFEDTNLNTGIIAGDLIIASRAAEEVTLEITSYNLYCGSSATTKTSAIEEVLVSTLTPGEVITIPIPNMNITDCPYLLIHTENDTGESTIPAFIMVIDRKLPNVDGITLRFDDTNPATGIISGDLIVTRATEEVNLQITSYNLYCGSSATSKKSGMSSPIEEILVSILTSGTNISITITDMDITGCPYLLIYTVNNTGESSQPASIMIIDAKRDILTAARGLLRRVLGSSNSSRLNDFVLEELTVPANFKKVGKFQVEASRGRVTIRGNNPLAIARGFYHYIKKSNLGQYTWTGSSINLPARLPDMTRVTIESPYQFHHFYNVVTFSYSMVFWDWARWEKEIDWLALRGVNLPLALVGVEAVWQKLWKEDYGLTDTELRNYFPGPAFLSWHRMGNLNQHSGPLPQYWIDNRKELQIRILNRMRELQMKPVVPAFAGFVPQEFVTKRSEISFGNGAARQSGWAGYPYTTNYMVPRTNAHLTLFKEVGKKFIQKYHQVYGSDGLDFYLADTYNENNPTTSSEVAQVSKATYEAINETDPGATWVVQGWTFIYHGTRNDWLSGSNKVRSFLNGSTTAIANPPIPNDKVLVINMREGKWHNANNPYSTHPSFGTTTEQRKGWGGWELFGQYYGKQWIFTQLDNFGARNPLSGNMPISLRTIKRVWDTPAASRGNLAGFGAVPEGIDVSEPYFEFMTDLAWTDVAGLTFNNWINDTTTWINDWAAKYCLSRYAGICPTEMQNAWKKIVRSVYSDTNEYNRYRWQWQVRGVERHHRNTLVNGRASSFSSTNFAKRDLITGTKGLLQEYEKLTTSQKNTLIANPLFKLDLIELVVQLASLKAAGHVTNIMNFLPRSQYPNVDSAIAILRKIDTILTQLPNRGLEKWLADAKAIGPNTAADEFLEKNIRLILTQWGTSSTVLYEYSARVWSGLIRDYYIPRWQRARNGNGSSSIINNFEKRWINLQNPGTPGRNGPGLSTAATLNATFSTTDLFTAVKKFYNEIVATADRIP